MIGNGDGATELTDRVGLVETDLQIVRHEQSRHGRILADHDKLLAERAGDREVVLSEILNVKRDLSDAMKPTRREKRWRMFWRLAQPALVAVFLEVLRRIPDVLPHASLK